MGPMTRELLPGARAGPLWVGMLLTGSGLAALICGLVLLLPALASKHWPFTQGTIVSSRLVQYSQSKSSVHSVAVTYRYRVNGHSHENDTFSHGSDSLPLSGGDKTKVMAQYLNDAAFQPWQSGQKVPVYYNPQNPGQSMLQTGATALGWSVTILGLFLTGIGTVEWRKVKPMAAASENASSTHPR